MMAPVRRIGVAEVRPLGRYEEPSIIRRGYGVSSAELPWNIAKAEMRKILERDGFVFQKKLLAHLSTVEVARRVGFILNVDKLLPSNQIPTVQSLSPRGI